MWTLLILFYGKTYSAFTSTSIQGFKSEQACYQAFDDLERLNESKTAYHYKNVIMEGSCTKVN